MISVIIPVYNNERTLAELSRRLVDVLEAQKDVFEIVYVNDGSRDSSRMVLTALAQRDTRIKVIDFVRNYGQQPAIRAGMDYSAGDVVLLMDADLEDEPEDIPRLLEAMTVEIKCVYTRLGRKRERWTSKVFHNIANRLTGAQTPAGVGTMRLFDRSVVHALQQFPERRPVWGPLMHYLNYPAVTIDIPDRNHRTQSSYNFIKRVNLAMDYLIGNTSIPFYMAFAVSFLMFLGSISYAAVIFVQAVLFGVSLPIGLSLLTFIVLILFSFNFLILGVLGMYANKILIESLRRPLYTVAATINL